MVILEMLISALLAVVVVMVNINGIKQLERLVNEWYRYDLELKTLFMIPILTTIGIDLIVLYLIVEVVIK
jgi:hypothetical protein